MDKNLEGVSAALCIQPRVFDNISFRPPGGVYLTDKVFMGHAARHVFALRAGFRLFGESLFFCAHGTAKPPRGAAVPLPPSPPGGKKVTKKKRRPAGPWPHSQPSWGFPLPRPSARVAERCAKLGACQQCRLKPPRKICLTHNPPGAIRNSLETYASLATLLELSFSAPSSEGRGALDKNLEGVSTALCIQPRVFDTRLSNSLYANFALPHVNSQVDRKQGKVDTSTVLYSRLLKAGGWPQKLLLTRSEFCYGVLRPSLMGAEEESSKRGASEAKAPQGHRREPFLRNFLGEQKVPRRRQNARREKKPGPQAHKNILS